MLLISLQMLVPSHPPKPPSLAVDRQSLQRATGNPPPAWKSDDQPCAALPPATGRPSGSHAAALCLDANSLPGDPRTMRVRLVLPAGADRRTDSRMSHDRSAYSTVHRHISVSTTEDGIQATANAPEEGSLSCSGKCRRLDASPFPRLPVGAQARNRVAARGQRRSDDLDER
jgi:hypothetical protein